MPSLAEQSSLGCDNDQTLRNLSPLVMGGAGFSYQLHSNPESLPVRQIILKAFSLGLRVLDTSPYYEPSEQLMGAAISHSEVTSKYKRSDYILMTKAGRIDEHYWDYSPEWIKKSVARSLQRFRTSYLDVVFCHDVEFVSEEEAVTAVGTLFSMSEAGIIKYVGISGYDIEVLICIANLVRARYGRPLDVVQTWAQLTLQNTHLESRGLKALREAGVRVICSSSPLAVGLLRNGGLPIGRTGDWHPAPSGLRLASQQAAEWVEERGISLASLALRFAISKAMQNSRPDFTVTTITGISSISDLEQNVETAKRILRPEPSVKNSNSTSSSWILDPFCILDDAALARDEPLFQQVRTILGAWVDYDFSRQAQKKDIVAIEDMATAKGETKVFEVELSRTEA